MHAQWRWNDAAAFITNWCPRGRNRDFDAGEQAHRRRLLSTRSVISFRLSI